MKDIELPPLSKFDHPEPRTMQWSDLELYAIKSYARAAVEADRAQRVPGGLTLAAIGHKHFGNPIPQAWYAAAKELLASTPAPAQQERKPMTDEQVYAMCARLGLAQLSPLDLVAEAERHHGIRKD